MKAFSLTLMGSKYLPVTCRFSLKLSYFQQESQSLDERQNRNNSFFYPSGSSRASSTTTGDSGSSSSKLITLSSDFYSKKKVSEKVLSLVYINCVQNIWNKMRYLPAA